MQKFWVLMYNNKRVPYMRSLWLQFMGSPETYPDPGKLDSRDQAEKVAKRLASTYKDHPFYILECVSMATIPTHIFPMEG